MMIFLDQAIGSGVQDYRSIEEVKTATLANGPHMSNTKWEETGKILEFSDGTNLRFLEAGNIKGRIVYEKVPKFCFVHVEFKVLV